MDDLTAGLGDGAPGRHARSSFRAAAGSGALSGWQAWALAILGLAVLAAGGAFFVDRVTNYGASFERDALLQATAAAAAAIEPDLVAQLHADPSDADLPAFAHLRDALRRIRDALPESRFVYLLRLDGEDVVFLVDAEPPESEDYSAPGDVYAEASKEMREVFTTGIAVVEGPSSDQWGTWVSGIAPVLDPETGKVAALFGIDIDAARWEAGVARYRWLGTAIAGLVAAIVIFSALFLILQHRSRAASAVASRIIETSPAILYRFAATPGYPMVFISDNIARLGYEPREFVSGQMYRGLIHPDDREAVRESVRRLASGESETESLRFRLRARDGSYRWFDSRETALRDTRGRLAALEGILVDITERRLAEEKVREAEAEMLFVNTLLKTELETSPDGILVVDADGSIISFNQRFADMWQLTAATLRGGRNAPVLAAVSAKVTDPEAFLARVRSLYENREISARDEIETVDGRFIDRHTAPLNADGKYLGRVWFFRDVTDRKLAEAQILRSARHDALTGLVNRTVFMEAVDQAMAHARRGGKGFAVLYIDLDHFKDVNDTLGHPVGDRLLKSVAARLTSVTRATDTVARFGGDEFAVIAADLDQADAAAAVLAEALLRVLAEPFVIEGSEIRGGASMGIAVYSPEISDAETLLSQADVALYRAKAEGRGDFRFFTEAMDAEVRNRVRLGTELREAIATNQLFLLYQPQIRVETGEITGVEALIRWRHPERGILGPSAFMDVAESNGLIYALGHSVLLEACRQQKTWIDEGIAPAGLSVNLSAMQFRRPAELERDIVAVLAETGLPPSRLELELTETVLMEASREHGGTLLRLRDAGVRLAIDDFGTGYSSLDYLRRFPTDRIKIAQSFVSGIGIAPHNAAIVKATIGLARELGISVIAEGVETHEQLALLKSWGCREVQGYYFAPPLPPDEIAPLLRAGRIEGVGSPPASSAA